MYNRTCGPGSAWNGLQCNSSELNLYAFYSSFLANVNYVVVRPSVVCNVRAPYSGDWNFRQCFTPFSTLDIYWLWGKILRRSSQGTPLAGVKPKRGSQIYERAKAISRKWCNIRAKLVLITNRKSYMSFRLVPKSVTLNDLERRNGRYIALFHW